MGFTLMHRDGDTEDGDVSRIPDLLAELDEPRDDEHPDIAISDDDTAWSLSAFQGGLVVWENVEDSAEPQHMANVPRAELHRVMLLVAEGRLDEVGRLDWRPGYHPPAP
ncbi:hypothetical protein ACQP2E_18375 [Actinoplanes sp. CA-015351]|uniref:hypothetical protein n=1 Tax=Actinoplanes sp. CA-015351 TaxID=3239897 RepID=UPI003D970C8E